MEALGGAASAISVVSLAFQVCEELKKVQDFWQSVNEAPYGDSHISTEINLFMTWLTIIANKYQRHGFKRGSPDEVAATDALKLCLATVPDMNDGVKDFESGLSKGLLTRRWVSVKFVFRKDNIEKLMRQIERMTSLLIMIQTCYIGFVTVSVERYQ